MARIAFKTNEEEQAILDKLDRIWRQLRPDVTDTSKVIKESLRFTLHELERSYLVQRSATRPSKPETAVPEKRFIQRIPSSEIKLDGSRYPKTVSINK